jgi:hypothetical protein
MRLFGLDAFGPGELTSLRTNSKQTGMGVIPVNASAPFCWTFWIRASLLACAVALCASAIVSTAQNPAGDYTRDLPSVQRVETEIKGTDPIDTAARQVAVFEYLQLYIRRIKEARDYRGPYSPGEQKSMTDYSKAQYDLTQSINKSHTPQEVAKFSQLEGQYSVNNALGWIKQLQGQQAADTYAGAEASLAQTYKQHEDKMQQQMKQENGESGGLMGGFLAAGGGAKLNDQQKRCMELGGTLNQCANGMMGLVNLIGNMVTLGAADDTPQQPPLSGVLLVGKYHSRTDLPEVMLQANGAAVLSQCGTLVESGTGYTFRKSSAGTQIVMKNEPDPIVLTLRSDGSLSGPGNVAVKGSIISGYNNVTTCSRQGTPYASCGTTSTPIYTPSMQRCTISQMAPQPAPPPPPKPKGMIGEMSEMFGMGDPVQTIYGFRMIGPYESSSGMLLDFNDTFVTLDCGKAHVNAPYTVDNTASGFVVHVQNVGGAFLLGVAPDATLRGSGSTTVNGKLVSSVQGENVSFTPHSESCSVGTFNPKGKQNTMVASNGPMPVVAAADPPASPARDAAVSSAASPASAGAESASIANSLAGAGITSAPGGGQAKLRVLLSSSFTGANPLAGQAVFVARKPMDQILRELGVAVPANATPGQAMKALQTQCHSPQGCSTVMQGLPKYYVTTAKLDTTGKATLSATAATGPYYFFAIAPNGGASLVWDVAANLQAGDNQVAFNDANAERLQ